MEENHTKQLPCLKTLFPITFSKSLSTSYPSPADSEDYLHNSNFYSNLINKTLPPISISSIQQQSNNIPSSTKKSDKFIMNNILENSTVFKENNNNDNINSNQLKNLNKKFNCHLCDFKTARKHDLSRHIS
ncbi:hypothetical protein HDU92_005974, partial [Lobulomyces angularis]